MKNQSVFVLQIFPKDQKSYYKTKGKEKMEWVIKRKSPEVLDPGG